MKSNTLEIPLELLQTKSANDKGTFIGLTAVYGNVDEGGDRIAAGAFRKTIQESGGKLPLLWSHETRSPIGVAMISDTDAGLLVNGVLNLGKQIGRDAYADLQFYQEHSIPFGMSIGYQTVKSYFDGDVRVLSEIRLFESSLTLFPMNQSALVESVKSRSSRIDRERVSNQISELIRLVKSYTR